MLDQFPPLAIAAAAIILGFIGLVWSADRFVAGAASIAESFGIAPVVIGLTIVSFGTSAPEVMVSLIAAIEGAGQIAVGNAIGSNIANVGLVLGVTLLISAIPVQKYLLTQEGGILFGITVLAGFFLLDYQIVAWEGWVLLALLVPIMWTLTVVKQRSHKPSELIDDEQPHYRPPVAVFWFFAGLVLLIGSSKILVWGAETTATEFGISQLVIGLSVIAIGTSLPELAASVVSALKGHHDIAVGNVIGSNIFNLLAVMSIPGIFAAEAMESEVFYRDFTAMFITTSMLLIGVAWVLYKKKTKPQLGRFWGALLLSSYAIYIFLLTV